MEQKNNSQQYIDAINVVYHILEEIRGADVAFEAYQALMHYWTYGTDDLLKGKIIARSIELSNEREDN